MRDYGITPLPASKPKDESFWTALGRAAIQGTTAGLGTAIGTAIGGPAGGAVGGGVGATTGAVAANEALPAQSADSAKPAPVQYQGAQKPLAAPQAPSAAPPMVAMGQNPNDKLEALRRQLGLGGMNA